MCLCWCPACVHVPLCEHMPVCVRMCMCLCLCVCTSMCVQTGVLGVGLKASSLLEASATEAPFILPGVRRVNNSRIRCERTGGRGGAQAVRCPWAWASASRCPQEPHAVLFIRTPSGYSSSQTTSTCPPLDEALCVSLNFSPGSATLLT